MSKAKVSISKSDQLMQLIVSGCSAAASGDVEVLNKLLGKRADLNKGDYDNRTPLHLAAATGHLKAVRFLVEIAKVKVN